MRDEDGRRVSRTKRFEEGEIVEKIGVDIIERDLRAGLDRGLQMVCGQRFFRDGFQLDTEGVDVLVLDRQPGRSLVPAVTLQQRLAPFQAVDDVKSFDAPTGTLAQSI